jgi:hypothetical protein
MKAKRYYIVVSTAYEGWKWGVEFGSFDKKEALAEMADLKCSSLFLKGTKFKVIDTDPEQESIAAVVHALNAKSSGELS